MLRFVLITSVLLTSQVFGLKKKKIFRSDSVLGLPDLNIMSHQSVTWLLSSSTFESIPFCVIKMVIFLRFRVVYFDPIIPALCILPEVMMASFYFVSFFIFYFFYCSP